MYHPTVPRLSAIILGFRLFFLTRGSIVRFVFVSFDQCLTQLINVLPKQFAAMKDFLLGMRLALPIVLGYLPVGFAFGVLAMQAGMTPVTTGLMSYLVYAGSGQLIAVGLLASGVSLAGIITTTFIVNLRHLLMSAALVPYLKNWSRPLQAWFSFEMTDESFAANLGRFCSHGVDKHVAFGLNTFAHAGWVTGGILGALFDSAIGDIKPLGLDFALPGMFIALILPHVLIPRRLLAVILGGFFSLSFSLIGAGQWSVMLATMAGATLAAFMPLPTAWDCQEAPTPASAVNDANGATAANDASGANDTTTASGASGANAVIAANGASAASTTESESSAGGSHE